MGQLPECLLNTFPNFAWQFQQAHLKTTKSNADNAAVQASLSNLLYPDSSSMWHSSVMEQTEEAFVCQITMTTDERDLQ